MTPNVTRSATTPAGAPTTVGQRTDRHPAMRRAGGAAVRLTALLMFLALVFIVLGVWVRAASF